MPVLYDGEDENGNPSYSWGVASYIVWRGVAFDIGLVGPYEITGMFTNYFGESYMITASLNSAPDYDGWWTGITPTSRFTEGLKCLEVFAYGRGGYPSIEAATAASIPVKNTMDNITANSKYTGRYHAYVDTNPNTGNFYLHVDYWKNGLHSPANGNDPDITKVNPNYQNLSGSALTLPNYGMLPVDPPVSDYPFDYFPQNIGPGNRMILMVWNRDDNNQPMADKNFKLQVSLATEYSKSDGGHKHYGNRSLGEIVYQNKTYAMTINQRNEVYDDLPNLKTNAQGRCVLEYRYPDIGSIIKFKIFPLTEEGHQDTGKEPTIKYLMVGLQDLKMLQNPASNVYVINQGATAALDHPLGDNTCLNKFVAEKLEEAIKGFIIDQKLWDTEHNRATKHIQVNDCSLPLGGVFDCNSDWSENKHMFHRAGWEADIVACDDTSINDDSTAASFTLTQDNYLDFVKKLNKVFPNATHAPGETPENKYYTHIYFYGSEVYSEGIWYENRNKNYYYQEEVSE